MISYRAAACKGVVLSKLDEAVKLAPALDAVIRHRQKIVAVANGQRVPEDWHAARAPLLVQKALMKQPASIFTPDDGELGLLLTTPPLAPTGPMTRGFTAEGPHA